MSVISIVTNPRRQDDRCAAAPGGVQLAGDEPDRHDAEPLRRLQQPRARPSRAASSSKATWPKRARALRTWAASWIGRRRLPCEST